MSALGHKLPFAVEGYAHPASALASGVKDADGLWVAKCHPLNATGNDLKRAERMAHMFAAAPEMHAALDPRSLEVIADEIDDGHGLGAKRAASLRAIAANQRAALAKAEVSR